MWGVWRLGGVLGVLNWVGKFRGTPALHALQVPAQGFAVQSKCLCVSRYTGIPIAELAEALVLVGTGQCAGFATSRAGRGANRRRPIGSGWCRPHLGGSEVGLHLPCERATCRHAREHLANLPEQLPRSLRAEGLWEKAQSGLCSDECHCPYCLGEPQWAQQILSASSKPETNAFSTRWPKHQSPQTPKPERLSHKKDLPKGSWVWA